MTDYLTSGNQPCMAVLPYHRNTNVHGYTIQYNYNARKTYIQTKEHMCIYKTIMVTTN